MTGMWVTDSNFNMLRVHKVLQQNGMVLKRCIENGR
jgi:hypothetical protein